MAATGYSFEEWLNWEAFLACYLCWGGQTAPKPGYRYLKLADTAELGDLWVDGSNGHGVVAEIALVHDETSNKWLEKLSYDREKLETARGDVAGKLQVVVLVSAREKVANNETWETWLRRALPERADFESVALDGRVVVRGWRR